MLKDLISHIMLDLRAHDMSVIRNKKVAVALKRHHRKHHRAQLCDNLQRFTSRHGNDMGRDIPHNQRNAKRYARTEDRKQQIREKKRPVWPVITGEPLPLMLHTFFPPFFPCGFLFSLSPAVPYFFHKLQSAAQISAVLTSKTSHCDFKSLSDPHTFVSSYTVRAKSSMRFHF